MTNLKKAHYLKFALIASILLSVIFLFVKLIFYLSIINKWKDTDALGSIASSLVSAFLIIAVKAYRYGPKIVHFHNYSKSKTEFDTSLAQDVKKFSLRVLHLYILTFSLDVFALFRVLDLPNNTLTLVPAIFSLATLPLGAAITLASYKLSGALLKNIEIPQE